MKRFVLPLVATAWLLGACITPPPKPATPKAEVLRQWGRPTATYPLAQGVERLEYATGPFGRTTWMIDIDAAGAVTQARQVLNEAEFMRLQSASGLNADDVLRWIGTPGQKRGARGGGQTWSWRYPTNDCLWFQASISAGGQLESAAYGVDPTCEARGDAKSSPGC